MILFSSALGIYFDVNMGSVKMGKVRIEYRILYIFFI